MAGLWPYVGLPPSRLSAFMYSSVAGQYLTKVSFCIKPRSLSDALAEVVEEAGRPVLYGSVAEEILVADGAVTGLRLPDATVLPASAVLSNASAITTLGSPGGDSPGLSAVARQRLPPCFNPGHRSE